MSSPNPSGAPAAPATDTQGQLEHLLMTRYTVGKDGATTLDKNIQFKTQINPSDFKHSHRIGYNTTPDMGAAKTEPKFASTEPEEVSFSIVLDDTGAVEDVPGQASDVKQQMELLSRVVYEYVGGAGEPPHVRLLWGALIFFGRLRSMSTQYSLFKPNGDPLRAKVDLNFVGASSSSKEQLVNPRVANKAMTRTVTVEEGDTVASLCAKHYKDDSPQMQAMVAEANGLTSLTDLTPGSQLVLPAKTTDKTAGAAAPAALSSLPAAPAAAPVS